jgi:hypothetical protein
MTGEMPFPRLNVGHKLRPGVLLAFAILIMESP